MTASFASYDGTRLAYAEVGSGPPLVCLAGGPGRSSAYLEDLAGLGACRTLVLLDGRATGHSELPADPQTLRYDRLAEDVEALRAHLGVPVVDVLAHSAGSLVAQAWASRWAGHVGSLVLVTPSGRLQASSYEDLPALVAERATEEWYPEAREALDALADASPAQRPALLRAVRPFMYGRWDERCRAHAGTADHQTSRRAELGFHPPEGADDSGALLAGLGAVQAPVLVVAGGRDALTGVAAARTVAGCFPHGTLVTVPGAGHFPWVDEPDAFREAVAGFLGARRGQRLG